jgi:hypothetical protein
LTCAPAPASQTSFVYGRLDAQSGAITATPVVADLDGDGDVEVAVVARYNEDNPPNTLRGEVWVWTGHKNGVQPWPMFRGNVRHTAVFPGPAKPILQPNPLTILYQFGGAGPATSAIRLTNGGTSPFDWTGAVPAGITLTPKVGRLAEGQSIVLAVEVATADLQPGNYPNGQIGVSATADLSPNAVTTNANVLLIVGDIKMIYLPILLRR